MSAKEPFEAGPSNSSHLDQPSTSANPPAVVTVPPVLSDKKLLQAIADNLEDPISGAPIENPVVLASGHVMDKSSIDGWIAQCRTNIEQWIAQEKRGPEPFITNPLTRQAMVEPYYYTGPIFSGMIQLLLQASESIRGLQQREQETKQTLQLLTLSNQQLLRKARDKDNALPRDSQFNISVGAVTELEHQHDKLERERAALIIQRAARYRQLPHNQRMRLEQHKTQLELAFITKKSKFTAEIETLVRNNQFGEIAVIAKKMALSQEDFETEQTLLEQRILEINLMSPKNIAKTNEGHRRIVKSIAMSMDNQVQVARHKAQQLQTIDTLATHVATRGHKKRERDESLSNGVGFFGDKSVSHVPEMTAEMQSKHEEALYDACLNSDLPAVQAATSVGLKVLSEKGKMRILGIVIYNGAFHILEYLNTTYSLTAEDWRNAANSNQSNFGSVMAKIDIITTNKGKDKVLQSSLLRADYQAAWMFIDQEVERRGFVMGSPDEVAAQWQARRNHVHAFLLQQGVLLYDFKLVQMFQPTLGQGHLIQWNDINVMPDGIKPSGTEGPWNLNGIERQQQQLITACRNGDICSVQKLIEEQSAYACLVMANGDSPLSAAIQGYAHQVITYLQSYFTKADWQDVAAQNMKRHNACLFYPGDEIHQTSWPGNRSVLALLRKWRDAFSWAFDSKQWALRSSNGLDAYANITVRAKFNADNTICDVIFYDASSTQTETTSAEINNAVLCTGLTYLQRNIFDNIFTRIKREYEQTRALVTAHVRLDAQNKVLPQMRWGLEARGSSWSAESSSSSNPQNDGPSTPTPTPPSRMY